MMEYSMIIFFRKLPWFLVVQCWKNVLSILSNFKNCMINVDKNRENVETLNGSTDTFQSTPVIDKSVNIYNLS